MKCCCAEILLASMYIYLVFCSTDAKGFLPPFFVFFFFYFFFCLRLCVCGRDRFLVTLHFFVHVCVVAGNSSSPGVAML